MQRLKRYKFVSPFRRICKALKLWFLLFGVAVLPLCDSRAKGSHAPSETHTSPAKETVLEAPYQAFIPCGFLTILLAQMMSPVMLLNNRSAGREAQPRELTQGQDTSPEQISLPGAVKARHSSSPGHRWGPGRCSFSPLLGCHQPHVLECCQAGTLICFCMASNNQKCMFSPANAAVPASVITCEREMEGGGEMGGRPIYAYDISISSCFLCWGKKLLRSFSAYLEKEILV